MPGAFMPTCSLQAPGYIEKYDEFQAKGINEMYVITVNDVFVTKCVLCPRSCARAPLVELCGKNNKSLFLLPIALSPLAFLMFPCFSSWLIINFYDVGRGRRKLAPNGTRKTQFVPLVSRD